MLKLRLKKYGRKGQISYRLVVMNSNTKRDGKTIEELGFYNPMTKEVSLNIAKVQTRLNQGVQTTDIVHNLLRKFALIN